MAGRVVWYLGPSGASPTEIALRGELVLGRELLAEIGAGVDATISRRHARIVEAAGVLQLEDLGSRSGTYLNDRRIEKAEPLTRGDRIGIGEHRFVLGEDEGFGSSEELYGGAALGATRAGAPERLRLVYDLSRLAGGVLSTKDIARRLHETIKDVLHPAGLAIWLLPDRELAAGSVEIGRGAIPPEVALERASRGQVMRAPPAGDAIAVLALPLGSDPRPPGAMLLTASASSPLDPDDVAFAAAAAALAGDAMKRSALVSELSLSHVEDEIVGDSAAIRRAKKDVDTVAPYGDLSVLLVGETGAGKELFARRVHRASGRPGPFVAVNVAALPGELVESELFGHTKGAFTGATAARTGYFEYARGGTLFLDEIGEMPQTLQAKLLRVLQDGRMTRVGDPRSVEVDVRLVAATNAQLAEKMKAGTFREDLYYRIAGAEIRIPPLRERREDIALLAGAFVRRTPPSVMRTQLGLSAEVVEILRGYPWPGNVRQLEATMRLAVIHALRDGATEILPEHVDERVRLAASPKSTPKEATLAAELERAEREIVARALAESRGNKREAARLLGWSVNTLRARLERYDLGGPSE